MMQLWQLCCDNLRRFVRIRLGAELRDRFEASHILGPMIRAALLQETLSVLSSERAFIGWFAMMSNEADRDASEDVGVHPRDQTDNLPPWFRINCRPHGVNLVATDMLPDYSPRVSWTPARLVACLETSSRGFRERFILREYMGLSWTEVAGLTGQPSGAAARMIHASESDELRRRMGDP